MKKDICCSDSCNCCQPFPSLHDKEALVMAGVLQTLGDIGRLGLVLACLHNERSVSELSELTGQSQSLTSHNLKRLKDNRILRSRKSGKSNLYIIDDNHIKQILTNLAHHIKEDV